MWWKVAQAARYVWQNRDSKSSQIIIGLLCLGLAFVLFMVFVPMVLIMSIAGPGGGAATAAIIAAEAQAQCDNSGLSALGGTAGSASLDDTQAKNVATIYETGQSMGIPVQGELIAVMTAIVESTLYNSASSNNKVSLNYPHDKVVANDKDSVGLFAQRVSEGWGTVKQEMDPAQASRMFYQRMVAIKNWRVLPPGNVAQMVQHSAFPDKYALQQTAAANDILQVEGPSQTQSAPVAVSSSQDTLFRNVTWSLDNGFTVDGTNTDPGASAGSIEDSAALEALINSGCDPSGAATYAYGTVAAGTWVNPIATKYVFGAGFGDWGYPGHTGQDLVVPLNTPVYAAAAGTISVMKVLCPQLTNAQATGNRACSYGRYMEIDHGNNISTLYAHWDSFAPGLKVGMKVKAGQLIGYSGARGHTTGPHLHFEVRVGGNPIEPTNFMVAHGVDLECGPNVTAISGFYGPTDCASIRQAVAEAIKPGTSTGGGSTSAGSQSQTSCLQYNGAQVLTGNQKATVAVGTPSVARIGFAAVAGKLPAGWESYSEDGMTVGTPKPANDEQWRVVTSDDLIADGTHKFPAVLFDECGGVGGYANGLIVVGVQSPIKGGKSLLTRKLITTVELAGQRLGVDAVILGNIGDPDARQCAPVQPIVPTGACATHPEGAWGALSSAPASDVRITGSGDTFTITFTGTPSKNY